MNKFCKRLRYSVGGTYRVDGPGKSLSVDKGSSRFFFIFTERLTKEGYRMAHPFSPHTSLTVTPFYSDNT